MPLDHKAYVFRVREFERLLRPLLEEAMRTGDTRPLIGFVDGDLAAHRCPYDGEILSQRWQSELENGDVHEVGDYALTRFYDPRDDIGLGNEWQRIADRMKALELPGSSALGETVGPSSSPFDPGRIGSYFQSEDDVLQNLRQLERVADPELAKLVRMLSRAADAGRGLYVTF